MKGCACGGKNKNCPYCEGSGQAVWSQVRNGSKPAAATVSAPVKHTRRISAAGKGRIAAAARARWARFRAAKKRAA